MYTGQRAWSGMHCTQIVIAVTIRQRRLLLPPEAPAAFRDLVQQCMSDRPADRPNFQARNETCHWSPGRWAQAKWLTGSQHAQEIVWRLQAAQSQP